VAWYGRTHPVKEKTQNIAGLYDMTGNVVEWCQGVFNISSDPLRVSWGGFWGDSTNPTNRCTVAFRTRSDPFEAD
jgi:formylglycine-generating enzyme required for sulfatase activity